MSEWPDDLDERIAGYLAGGWGRAEQAPAQGESQWYAVCVESGRERRIAASLAERGVTFFLPMETRWHKPQWGPREPRQAPLLPGYVFLLGDLEQLAEVRGFEGVIGFVRYIRADGEAWPVCFPAEVILGLQIEERQGFFDHTRKARPRYRPKRGDTVKITAGPYFGVVAKVLATPRGRRAKILIEAFGKPRHRTEDVAHLAAA